MSHTSTLQRLRRLAVFTAFASLGILAAARAQTPDLDACGHATDSAARVKACSNIIAAPGNPPAMIAWAYANRCQAQENNRRYDPAIADCSEALRLDPNMANAYDLRGFAYYAKGDSVRALADYDSALRLKPDDSYAHAARGHIYLAQRDYDRAIQEFTAALALTPNDAWSLSSRGYAYSLAGDNDHAVQDLEAAAKLDPRAYLTRLRLAEALAVAGSGDQALALDQETLRLFAAQAQAIYRERCLHQAILGKTTAAVADCNRVLQRQPKDALALAYRGYARLRAGANDAAIADYTSALAIRPKDAPSLFGRGVARAAKGDMAASGQDLAAARAADAKIDAVMARLKVAAPSGVENAAAGTPAPSASPPAAEGSADAGGAATSGAASTGAAGLDDKTLCSGRKRAPLADEIAACTRMLQANPDADAQAWAYARRGTAYTDQRDFDKAIQDYSAAIQIAPDLAYAYSGRGLAYYYKGALDEAIADQDYAIKLLPTFSGAYGARGYAHLKAGNSAAAHDDFDAALKSRPGQAIWLFGRATAEAALGRQQEAETDLAAARKLDPSIESTVADLFEFKPASP